MDLNEDFFKPQKNEKGQIDLKEMVALGEDEQLLWTGKPDKKVFMLEQFFKMFPIALLWLCFDGLFIGGITYGIISGGIPPLMIIFFVIFFAIHLMPVWIWLSHILTARRRLKNTEYAFTNKRIIIKEVFFANLTNIMYSEISSVNLHIGFLDRMFHVGDIVIYTSSSKTHVLEDLHDPYLLVNRLQQIVVDIKTDIEFPNDLRPETNSGYKTKYKG